jgi:hypothetical protein
VTLLAVARNRRSTIDDACDGYGALYVTTVAEEQGQNPE